MQLHNLQRHTPLRKKKYIGRGGKRGTTSGRGTKGQKSRAGHKIRPELRDDIKKLPKLRGYRFNSFETKAVPVNVRTLDTNFAVGETVSPKTLVEKKVIRLFRGAVPQVKILGTGDILKGLTIESCLVSASAKEKIEKAGGSIR